MHNRTTPTVQEMGHTAATVTTIVGYVGMLTFFGAAAGMWGLRRTSRVASHTIGHMWTRLSVYALVLGALYPVAMLNRIVMERPGDGALVPFSMVVLNAVVWCVALSEVIAWFTKYDGNPPNWNVYDLLQGVARLCVFVIAAAAVTSENARFFNLLAIVPLVATLLWTAMVEAVPARSLAVPPFEPAGARGAVTRPRLVAALLALVGLTTLVLESLAPSYGNVVGVGTAALFMLGEHVLLAVPLLLMATAVDGADPTRPATPPPRRRESPPVDEPAPVPTLAATLPPAVHAHAPSPPTLLAGAWDDDGYD